VVTGHVRAQVEAVVGDGSAFGLEVRIVHQPAPDGSADAVRRALAAGARPPLLISAADTRFGDGDVTRFVAAATDHSGALAIRRLPAPGRGRTTVRVANGRVERVLDDEPAGTFTGAPLWAFGPAVVAQLDDLPGPPYALAEAMQRAIAAGESIAAIEIGPTRDLTTPFDVLEENFPYLRNLPGS
jgi:glucose-1-phosphate thymidylyltransferase